MEYKNYSVEFEGPVTGYKIMPLGKGSVSTPLRGRYTTASEAYKAVDAYLNTVEADKQDGKAKQPSTD